METCEQIARARCLFGDISNGRVKRPLIHGFPCVWWSEEICRFLNRCTICACRLRSCLPQRGAEGRCLGRSGGRVAVGELLGLGEGPARSALVHRRRLASQGGRKMEVLLQLTPHHATRNYGVDETQTCAKKGKNRTHAVQT